MGAAKSIREKLYDHIRVADEKKLHAIYSLLENEITFTSKWWEDQKIIAELDKRYAALENGTDKGVTAAQLEESITQLRNNKYSR